MMDVFKGYNSLILPLRNDSQPITVRMTLQLVLLINVDEKDQVGGGEVARQMNGMAN